MPESLRIESLRCCEARGTFSAVADQFGFVNRCPGRCEIHANQALQGFRSGWKASTLSWTFKARYNPPIVMNSFFNWLKDSGTQALLVLVGTFAACIAAVSAIYYGRKSLTKKDLEVLEAEAAATAGHLAQQREQETLRNITARANISIIGNNYEDEPLLVYFSTNNKQVTLTSVDLLSEDNDTIHGSSLCNKVGSGTFTASIKQTKLRGWFDAGKAINGSEGRVRLRIHITMAERSEEKIMTAVLGTFNVVDERKGDGTTTRRWEIGGTV